MLLILCGKSGSGKDTLAEEILRRYPDEWERLVSTTTRPMRDGEVNGREYHFIDKEEFRSLYKEGKMIEFRGYDTNVAGVKDTWYYGTVAFEKPEKNIVAIKDLEGALKLQQYCDILDLDCATILVEVDDSVREARAKMRGSFDQTEWNRRMKADAIDFSEENVKKSCDFGIKNDRSLDYALGGIEGALLQMGLNANFDICKDSDELEK